MVGQTRFPDGDPSALVSWVQEKLLKKRILVLFGGKFDGVIVRPAGEAGGARVHIRRPPALGSHTTIVVSVPPGVDPASIPGRLDAAGVAASGVKVIPGGAFVSFPKDTPGAELVRLGLAIARASGIAPAGGYWEYEPTEPDEAPE